jgi:hypothetical protein
VHFLSAHLHLHCTCGTCSGPCKWVLPGQASSRRELICKSKIYFCTYLTSLFHLLCWHVTACSFNVTIHLPQRASQDTMALARTLLCSEYEQKRGVKLPDELLLLSPPHFATLAFLCEVGWVRIAPRTCVHFCAPSFWQVTLLRVAVLTGVGGEACGAECQRRLVPSAR